MISSCWIQPWIEAHVLLRRAFGFYGLSCLVFVLNPSHNISFYGEDTVKAHGKERVLYCKSVVKTRDSILIKDGWKDLQAAILVNREAPENLTLMLSVGGNRKMQNRTLPLRLREAILVWVLEGASMERNLVTLSTSWQKSHSSETLIVDVGEQRVDKTATCVTFC